LTPIIAGRRATPRAEIEHLLARTPLDADFEADVASVVGTTIDEL